MSAPKEDEPVRLNRRPFSHEWEAVVVNAKGLITWRRPIDPVDALLLEEVYQRAQEEPTLEE